MFTILCRSLYCQQDLCTWETSIGPFETREFDLYSCTCVLSRAPQVYSHLRLGLRHSQESSNTVHQFPQFMESFPRFDMAWYWYSHLYISKHSTKKDSCHIASARCDVQLQGWPSRGMAHVNCWIETPGQGFWRSLSLVSVGSEKGLSTLNVTMTWGPPAGNQGEDRNAPSNYKAVGEWCQIARVCTGSGWFFLQFSAGILS